MDGTGSTNKCDKNQIEHLLKKYEGRRPLRSSKHGWKIVLIWILKK